MAYSPGITYSGAGLWADALGSVGENVAKALDRTEEIRKQNALNDPIMQHALETGRITQDEYNKYHEGSFAQKASIANGVMANVHDDWQRQMFAQQQQDKAMERALQLQIAHMAHDPSPLAGQPIFGPAPAADPAYAERGLDQTTPTGQPVPTQGPQVGVWGEKGQATMFPWREVTGVNPDGTLSGTGQVNVDNTTLPGSTIITKEGSKQMKVIPKSGGQPGEVITGEGIPENTLAYGPGGKVITLPKDVRRKLEAAAMPTPSPTPLPIQTRVGNYIWNSAFGGTPTPTPGPSPMPSLAPDVTAPLPAQTPIPAVPTVVAPTVPAQKIFVVSPDGKQSGFIKPERWPDYQAANWIQGTPPTQ